MGRAAHLHQFSNIRRPKVQMLLLVLLDVMRIKVRLVRQVKLQVSHTEHCLAKDNTRSSY